MTQISHTDAILNWSRTLDAARTEPVTLTEDGVETVLIMDAELGKRALRALQALQEVATAALPVLAEAARVAEAPVAPGNEADGGVAAGEPGGEAPVAPVPDVVADAVVAPVPDVVVDAVVAPFPDVVADAAPPRREPSAELVEAPGPPLSQEEVAATIAAITHELDLRLR